MKSTGEVMGVGDSFGEAFAKAQLSAGQTLPTSGTVFISIADRDNADVAELGRRFVELGFNLVATHGTANILEDAGLAVERVYKVKEGRPNVVDLIKGERIQLILNTSQGQDPWFDEQAIRHAAVIQRVPALTTISAARAAADGIAALQPGQICVRFFSICTQRDCYSAVASSILLIAIARTRISRRYICRAGDP